MEIMEKETVIDSSEKLLEIELRKLSRVVEQGQSSVVITDRNGIIEYVNPRFCELSGYSKEDVIGKNPGIWKSGFHNKIFYEDLWNTILAGKNWSGEILNKRKNGELFWQSALISPLLDSKGEIINFVAIKEDITEKKRMISELIIAKEKAETTNNLKDAFIANISHEIRTPLNGIMGLTGLIRDNFAYKIGKDDEHLFEEIDKASNRIIRTFDMIVNYSRLQIGDFTVLRKKLDVPSICNNVVKEYAAEAQKKSLNLKFQNNCGDIILFADEFSINLAVSNLIDNAVKFTQSGFIDIMLNKEINGDVILSVTDSGIGMDDGYLEKIFEPYNQAQTGYGRASDGIGLGLSLVKKVLALNNATISVTSIKGAGSSFSINFSKEVHPDTEIIGNNIKPATSFPLEVTNNPVVLIVEDDKINQLTIKMFLANRYTTIITDSSDEVFGILNSNNVDIILMDISIWGKMNGLELTKVIKATQGFSHIPVIAVTAHAFEDDIQNAKEAGCDSFLAKPFSKKSLLDMIESFLSYQKMHELCDV